MKGKRFVPFFVVLLLFSPCILSAAQVTLSWDPPTTNADGTPLTDLSGYIIHYGTTSGVYTVHSDVGNVTTYTILTLADCTTYYFAVTAYDISRNESAYSNQVSKTTTCAALPPSQYTLTATKGGRGSGTVTSSPAGISCGTDCSEPFAQNTVVQLTAAPATNSTFAGWSGSCTGTATTCSVTVSAAKTATATFNLRQFTITASAGSNGIISPSGSVLVDYGTNRTFTITPNANYRVADVRVDNVSMGAITTYTFNNVTANHTIAATFTANTTALTVTKSGTGSGTVTSSPAGINCGTDCSEPFAQNTVVQLAAAPTTNSTFTGWSGACVGNAATCTVTMDAARTVAAAFSDNGPAAEPVEAVASGDFNNDGIDDMAIIDATGLVSYSTNVNSSSPTWIPVPGQLFSTILAGNFRSSRAGDELAGITTDGRIFYTRDFLAWTQIPLTGTLTTLVAGNFNNARTGDELAGLAPDGTVFVTLGTSITAGFNKVNGKLTQLLSGDVNNDGQTDLIGLNVSSGKIWVSTNAGTTWTQVPGRLSQVVSADFNGDAHFDIAGINAKGTIWFTTDLGSSWTQVPGQLSQVVSADINGDGRFDIAGLSTTGTVWFTANLGATWTTVPGTLTQLIRGDFNGDGTDDLAGVSPAGKLFLSTDRMTWTEVPR